jgi:hypothetical protein
MVYVSAVVSAACVAQCVGDAQMPMTRAQMAKPVMVFFTRYGARARSRAGDARILSS